MSFFWVLVIDLLFIILYFFCLFIFLFLFFVGAAWVTNLVVISFLVALFFLVCEFVFLWFWTESPFSVWVIFLGFFFFDWYMCTFIVFLNGNSWLRSVHFCNVNKWH